MGSTQAAGLDETEPERGHFGEQPPFAGDGCGEDDVKGGEAVGGDHENASGRLAGSRDSVDVADLSLPSAGQVKARVKEGRLVSQRVGGVEGSGHGAGW